MPSSDLFMIAAGVVFFAGMWLYVALCSRA
jgi:hypothetical protein